MSSESVFFYKIESTPTSVFLPKSRRIPILQPEFNRCK